MPPQSPPDARGEIDIAAPATRVYQLVSDPGALAELAEEYSGFHWLDGATTARVGARFRGSNRNGVRRWSTVSTITDAEAGRRFAFEVTSFGLPVARWQYDIEPAGAGCRVVEQTWEKRPGWFRVPSSLATGVWHRDARNRASIVATLRKLKTKAES
jgi:hypothetical protein